MIGLVYYYRSYERLREEADKLRDYWKDIPMVLIVYEFRVGDIYGMVVTPRDDSVDPSRFLSLVQGVLGEAYKMVDALPKDVSYTNRWMVGLDTLDAYIEG